MTVRLIKNFIQSYDFISKFKVLKYLQIGQKSTLRVHSKGTFKNEIENDRKGHLDFDDNNNTF